MKLSAPPNFAPGIPLHYMDGTFRNIMKYKGGAGRNTLDIVREKPIGQSSVCHKPFSTSMEAQNGPFYFIYKQKKMHRN